MKNRKCQYKISPSKTCGINFYHADENVKFCAIHRDTKCLHGCQATHNCILCGTPICKNYYCKLIHNKENHTLTIHNNW